MQTNLRDTVFGHDWAIGLLENALAADNFPQSLLITGLPQVGKMTLAKSLAMALVCTGPVRPCGQCAACRKILSGNHLDVDILDTPADEAAEAIKIETVRGLQRKLSLRPNEARYRVVVLGNFERATTGAANALLKTLEEPPAHVTLILTTPDKARLLPTIVSRCQTMPLRSVPTETIRELLKMHYRVAPPQAELLAKLAGGRPGWAISAWKDSTTLARRESQLNEFITLLGQGYAFRLQYAQQLIKANVLPAALFILWLGWWHDVLLVRQGAHRQISNLDFEESIQLAAQRLSPGQIMAAINQTYAALQNLQYNINGRLNIEVLLLNLPQLAL